MQDVKAVLELDLSQISEDDDDLIPIDEVSTLTVGNLGELTMTSQSSTYMKLHRRNAQRTNHAVC